MVYALTHSMPKRSSETEKMGVSELTQDINQLAPQIIERTTPAFSGLHECHDAGEGRLSPFESEGEAADPDLLI